VDPLDIKDIIKKNYSSNEYDESLKNVINREELLDKVSKGLNKDEEFETETDKNQYKKDTNQTSQNNKYKNRQFGNNRSYSQRYSNNKSFSPQIKKKKLENKK